MRFRAVLLLLFVVVLLLVPGILGIGAAVAEESVEAAPAITPEAYEEMLRKSPTAKWALLLLKILPVVLGIAFLIALYLAWNRRQAEASSQVPPPIPTGLGSPPGPTVPFGGVDAILVTIAAALLGGLIAHFLVGPLLPGGRQGLLFDLVFVALIEIPLALVIIARRYKLRDGQTTAPKRALRAGFVAFAIGSAVALPLAIAGVAVLTSIGVPLPVQDVLLKALDPSSPSNLWLIAAFGILVAPFAEEAMFRALFFPALRRSAGGGRQGFWIAAILVSVFFAVVHASWYAALPLFGLAMVLTIVFEKTNSLSTIILGHAFYNASTMVPLLIARLDGVI